MYTKTSRARLRVTRARDERFTLGQAERVWSVLVVRHVAGTARTLNARHVATAEFDRWTEPTLPRTDPSAVLEGLELELELARGLRVEPVDREREAPRL